MKAKTLKINRIIVTTLFSILTTLILYESVCPADMSLITPVSDFVKSIINSINPPKVIPLERIEIKEKVEYVNPNKFYTVFYDLYPTNASDTNIKFENLTPQYLDIKNDSFVPKNNPNDIQPNDAVGKIKLYSASNPEIYDIYEFKIRKTAPETLNLRTNLKYDKELNEYDAYLNEELYFDYKINETKYQRAITYSSPINIKYDNSYFSKLNDIKLIPKKLGKTKIKVYSRDFLNLEKDITINVKNRPKLAIPNEIGLFNIKNEFLKENQKPLVYKKWEFAILDENKNKIDVPFKIKVEPVDGKTSNNFNLYNDNWIKFLKPNPLKIVASLYGDYEGTTLTKIVVPRHIYTTPTVTSKHLDLETMTLTIPKYESEYLNVKFTGATYTRYVGYSDKPSVAKVINQSGIRVKGVSAGKTKIIISPLEADALLNGFDLVEINVTVTTPMIKDEHAFGLRFRKSIGHMMGFLFDGILFNLMVYLWSKGKLKTWLYSLNLPIGFCFAGVSELLQMIQPTRGPSFMDVGIDLIGWSIGVLIILSILLTIYLVKNKKKTKEIS